VDLVVLTVKDQQDYEACLCIPTPNVAQRERNGDEMPCLWRATNHLP
jgi:hypothetical protein